MQDEWRRVGGPPAGGLVRRGSLSLIDAATAERKRQLARWLASLMSALLHTVPAPLGESLAASLIEPLFLCLQASVAANARGVLPQLLSLTYAASPEPRPSPFTRHAATALRASRQIGRAHV